MYVFLALKFSWNACVGLLLWQIQWDLCCSCEDLLAPTSLKPSVAVAGLVQGLLSGVWLWVYETDPCCSPLRSAGVSLALTLAWRAPPLCLSRTGKRYNVADVSAAVCMSLGLIWFTLADSTIAPNFNLTGRAVCSSVTHALVSPKQFWHFLRILNDRIVTSNQRLQDFAWELALRKWSHLLATLGCWHDGRLFAQRNP